MDTRNPFLQHSKVPLDYHAVTLDNMLAAFDFVLQAHEHGIARIIDAQQTHPTWDDFVLAIDELDAQLLAVFNASLPLLGRGEDWGKAVLGFYGKVVERFDQKLTNGRLQALYERLARRANGVNLDAHKRATLRWYLDNFAISGTALDTDGKARLAELQRQITTLRGQYQLNLNRPGLRIDDEARLRGIPQRVRDELASRAREAGERGWLIACETAVTETVLMYAEHRPLRESVYRAYHLRGVSEDGQQDNGTYLQRLAELLDEKALLLGFANHPELSLQAKSAGGLAQVNRFLHDLADNLRPAMIERRSRIESQAAVQGVSDPEPWDMSFLQARHKASTKVLSTESLREFFPLPVVVSALTQLAEKLFGLVLVPKPFAAWDDSVQTFEAWQDNALIGFLYLDAVQHPGKQLDWVSTTYIRSRRVNAEGVYQEAAVVVFSDIPAAVDGGQPLLDHLSLRKLYHEFGHALHHLLVRTTNHVLSNVSALGTDGVELFGKLFERWVWNADYLAGISSHQWNGTKLDRTRVEECLGRLRQDGLEEAAGHLSLALFDLDLHATPKDGRTLEQRLTDARARCGYWPLADFERPAHAFQHLVSGYDAGYYAYLWSDVHAFDLFTRFEAQGLLDRGTGRALQEALFAPGASRPLREGIEAFLGRAPSHLPYLRWHGVN